MELERLDAFLGGMVQAPSPRANPGDPVTARSGGRGI